MQLIILAPILTFPCPGYCTMPCAGSNAEETGDLVVQLETGRHQDVPQQPWSGAGGNTAS